MLEFLQKFYSIYQNGELIFFLSALKVLYHWNYYWQRTMKFSTGIFTLILSLVILLLIGQVTMMEIQKSEKETYLLFGKYSFCPFFRVLWGMEFIKKWKWMDKKFFRFNRSIHLLLKKERKKHYQNGQERFSFIIVLRGPVCWSDCEHI